MTYQPPFTITPKITCLISDIAEIIGKMQEFNNVLHAPKLRRENQIKTITGTLAIEGNRLTKQQVSAILEGKRVLGSLKELAEVKGAIDAYEHERLTHFKPCSVSDLLKAHQLMMKGVMNDAGQYRKRAVGIYKGKEVIHVAPQASRVSALMDDLFSWMEKSDHHPLVVSSVFHYELEFIHPFTDGNGRMGRLWQTLILSRFKPLFLFLPLESLIHENQHDYYRALELADSKADCTIFIEFMLETIHQMLQANALVNAPVNASVKSVNIEGLKTPDAILEILSHNKRATRAEMAKHIKKDIRTIGRAIKKLQENKLLKRVGSDKSGFWEVL